MVAFYINNLLKIHLSDIKSTVTNCCYSNTSFHYYPCILLLYPCGFELLSSIPSFHSEALSLVFLSGQISQLMFTQKCLDIASMIKEQFCQVQNSWVTVLFFQDFNYVILLLLVSKIFVLKSAINLLEDPLYIMSHFSL